ncbi:cold-shock protein [Paucibacter soli]|uniref:cold-shock protein n=1 Tax=Paucibacter soli TaxID=3133433 RepID=UPI0030A81293
MRFEGKLQVWNAERGHGMIAPLGGGQPLFVHVSAFPPDGPPPVQDETLSFEIVTGRDGRKQAARVRRSQPKLAQAWAAPSRRAPPRRRGWSLALGLALMAGAGVLAWLQLSHAQQPEKLAQLAPAKASTAGKH